MYLTQGQSTFLFTVVRLALQSASLFLIAHIASRTYNVTYLERINGSVLSRINYLCFSKFPSRRKHHLGRFFVALTLVITTALTYLPTLLSSVFPVRPIFLESNQQPFHVPATKVLKPTSLSPGHTTVEDILLGMGLSLNGSEFKSYSAKPSALQPCHQMKDVDTNVCPPDGGEYEVSFRTSEEAPLILGYTITTYPQDLHRTGMSPTGETFRYFELTSDDCTDYTVVNMFRAAALETRFYYSEPERPNGPRSVEYCLIRQNRDHRCVRHSLGYTRSNSVDGEGGGRNFLISRRVSVQTINERSELGVDIPPDCKKLATSSLVVMCQQIIGLDLTPSSRVFSMENRTEAVDGSIHWDVVTSSRRDRVDRYSAWFVEAFSVDIKIEPYETTWDEVQFQAANSSGTQAILQVDQQEIFEATYVVPDSVNPFNHSWVESGFSKDDMDNLKAFLLGGTLVNSGALLIIPPSLLADVSNIAIGLLFGTSLLMVVLALIFSRGVPATVRNPISEVLQEVQASQRQDCSSFNPDTSTSTITAFLRKRRVASLVLHHQALPDIESDNKSTTTNLTPPLSSQRVRLVLHMEVDSDDDDETIQLLETVKRRNGDLNNV